MDRDALMGKAREFNRQFPNPPENWDANGTAETMADFALGMYEAGRRDERERILETLDDLLRTQNKYELIEAFLLYDLINKLRQTEPAESGERGNDDSLRRTTRR